VKNLIKLNRLLEGSRGVKLIYPIVYGGYDKIKNK
jgi:hypothetical protein